MVGKYSELMYPSVVSSFDFTQELEEVDQFQVKMKMLLE